jgi:hypothetical protein
LLKCEAWGVDVGLNLVEHLFARPGLALTRWFLTPLGTSIIKETPKNKISISFFIKKLELDYTKFLARTPPWLAP